MRFILLIFTCIIAFVSRAENPSDKYIKEHEEALLEVVYIRKAITDTTMRDSRFKLDPVILRIGKTKSMFCGEKKLWEDSLSKINYSSYYKILIASWERKDYFVTGGRYWAYIYKDFQNNVCKEYEYFDMERSKYAEDLQTPEWTITDSVKTIHGYECFQATTDFKGRHWIAWFTPEIPISDGPWKLHGLSLYTSDAADDMHCVDIGGRRIIKKK